MIIVDGPAELGGEITIQGAKNSTLPLLAAAVICKGQTVLHNCPRLSDVETAVRILEHLGCRCRREGSDLIVDNAMTCCEIPNDLMRGMRSSIVFLGALVSRCGEANLYFPGGCELGPRPIDLHISSLKKLGVEIEETGGCLHCRAPHGIVGNYVSLSFPSVGATENLMLAAVCSHGTTIIANAAREPEISDLAAYLNRCGGRIYGAGESCIIIDGVKELFGSEHRIMPCLLYTSGIEAQYTDEEYETLDMVTPSAVGLTLEEAYRQLDELGLSYSVVGDESDSSILVTEQIPQVGENVPKGGKVVLYTNGYSEEDTLVEVPDFTSMDLSNANYAASLAGVQISVSGAGATEGGSASMQSVEPGTMVKKGTVITITFVENINTETFVPLG